MCMGAHMRSTHFLEVIAPAADDTLVFLGDLVDQGPQTREVIERIIELKSRCHVVIIEGNHEEMMFAARETSVRSAIGRIVAEHSRSLVSFRRHACRRA